jgi:hypothetical protein
MAQDQEEEKSPNAASVGQSEVPEPIQETIAESSIQGQVASTQGPMVNAVVSVGMISALSDSKGNFLLEHIPPGFVKLRVKPTTSRYYNFEQEILVEAGKKKEGLFLFLNEVTGTIKGTVADENGKPLAEVEVSGLFRLAKPATTVKTDEKGQYLIPDVPSGNYYVRAKAQGHMIEGASVSIAGGSTVITNFTLKSANLSITGKIVSKKDGAPLDSEIYLMRKGIVVTKLRTTSADGGKFSFENLLPEIYEINVVCPGHIGKTWRQKLEQSQVLDFELEEQPLHPPQIRRHR